MAAAAEFELIRRHFAELTAPAADVLLGIGDDAALLSVPPGQQLVVTTDSLVAGRHFPLASRPFDIGYKALAVNLSDLAAMGAEARWFTLALSLPEADEAWLAGFASGLKALAEAQRVALVGGDTTRGPLTICITALGLVPASAALRRDGARVGDVVCVTGTLGDAALGLQRLQCSSPPPCGEGLGEGVPAANAVTSPVATPPPSPLPQGEGEQYLVRRLNRPTPRLAEGLVLRGLAHAAVDLSDGLAGDLGHILSASAVGAELDAALLPQSPAFAALAPGNQKAALQLHGGDDYELCLCIPPARLAEAQASLAALGTALTVIGHIVAKPGLHLSENGRLRELAPCGYSHF